MTLSATRYMGCGTLACCQFLLCLPHAHITLKAEETWSHTRRRCAALCSGELQRTRVRIHRSRKVAGAEERVAAVLQEGRVAVSQARAVSVFGLILGTQGRHELCWV